MGLFNQTLQGVIDNMPGTTTRDVWLGLDAYTAPNGDAEYKTALTQKIIDHYYLWEIGQESPMRFSYAMKIRMQEIMPYYNQLYATAQLSFDPLKTVSLSSVSNGTATKTATGVDTVVETTSENSTDTSNTGSNNTVTQKGRTIDSSFPQTMLEGSGDYADSGVDVSSTGTTALNGTATDTGVRSGTENRSDNSSRNESDVDSRTSSTNGYQANLSLLLNDYRATILNIDMLIVNALYDLFMLVWNNGDEYMPERGATQLPIYYGGPFF